MRPKRGTKAYNEEFVYAYYGIHMDTFTVDSVWQRRNGTLSGPNGGSHYIPRGQRPESEIMLVYGLTNVRMLPINMVESHGPKVTEELKAIAAEMRATREGNT
ncbi:hypothetical protein [Sinorhizobium meliloti]|uniref:hypothetical protein n=1 Tax=Rhizobium meliloti TaxID=382 RepID=UPI003F1595F3